MTDMIFNSMNLVILLIVGVLCYSFWKPYIRGKRTKAVVDGYCHPKDDRDKDIVWCYRLMYRESKAGKRLYCYTRKHYDTREEMRAQYPKGTEVEIKYYDGGQEDMQAVILSDKDDRKLYSMYTLAAFLGGIGIAVGYQLLMYELGAR